MRELRPWAVAVLLACLVGVLVGSFLLAPPGAGGAFTGSDAVATALLTDAGVRPWFAPLFTPGSTELEAGLFALQAALGGGVLGYALGRLHGRVRPRPERRPAPGEEG